MDDSLKVGLIAGACAGIGFFIGTQAVKPMRSNFVMRLGRAKKKVETLGAQESRDYIKSRSPLIIDVRDSADIQNGIEGSVNIPLSNLFFAADQNFALPDDVVMAGGVKIPKGTKFVHEKLQCAKDTPILVSCALGGQALIGAEVLVDYGFTEVRAIDGGNAAWATAGGLTCPCGEKAEF
mmetsp:Transcript_85475/g.169603  ORF Transcript_85475/g.169603 Transcript_85475/m.169603 type:complete len:180 (-) Transcript_85475:7-546(-)